VIPTPSGQSGGKPGPVPTPAPVHTINIHTPLRAPSWQHVTNGLVAAACLTVAGIYGWKQLGSPTPTPGPSATATADGLRMGRDFRGSECDALADAREKFLSVLVAGGSVDDARKAQQDTHIAKYRAAYEKEVGPTESKYLPPGGDLKDEAARAKYIEYVVAEIKGLRDRGRMKP
jgi:hypothetical protein